MKLRRIIVFFLAWAIGFASVEAQDLSKIYTPEYFGLSIGMSDQDMLNSMASQGFTFQAGGEYEHVKGTKQYSPMLDYMLVVNELNGSSEIWSAGNVLLGVRGPELVAVGEINELPRFDGWEAFNQIKAEIDTILGPSSESLPNYRWRRGKEKTAADQFNGMIWYSSAKPPADAEPESYAWPHGDVLTVLTMRNNMTLDGHVDKRRKIITLWHLKFCDIDIMDKMFEGNSFKCE